MNQTLLMDPEHKTLFPKGVKTTLSIYYGIVATQVLFVVLFCFLFVVLFFETGFLCVTVLVILKFTL